MSVMKTSSKCDVLYSKCETLYELFYGSKWPPENSEAQTLRRCLDILEAISGQPPSSPTPLDQTLRSIHTCTLNIRSLVMGGTESVGGDSIPGIDALAHELDVTICFLRHNVEPGCNLL